MIDHLLMPELGRAEVTELARMLLARKLMPDDRIALLSPMVNAPLAQSVMLLREVPVALGDWLPRLKDRFLREMAETRADPSLSRYLAEMKDDTARENLIGQFFLPFQPAQGINWSSAGSIAEAFVEHVTTHAPVRQDMGPLYPTTPDDGRIVLPSPFVGSIFDQILIGRHSQLHLEARRLGKTNEAASDAVIRAMMETLAASEVEAAKPRPFHTLSLRRQDLAQSFAYAQMMELGFSRDEMMSALAPWNLVD